MLGNLITVKDLSERLKVSKSWVYRKSMEKGPDSIPVVKVGKYIRFARRKCPNGLNTKENKTRYIRFQNGLETCALGMSIRFYNFYQQIG